MNTITREPISRRHRGSVGPNVDPGSILAILEWLAGDECHSIDEAGLVAGLGLRLRQIGLLIDRLTLHLMTLHPEILGRTVAWAPSEPVEIHDRDHGIKVEFASSPLVKVMESREPMIVDAGDRQSPWQHIDVFAGRNLVQLMIAPLCNVDGPVSAAGFGTKRPGGFTLSEIRVIERILPSLRNTCEMRVMRHAELSLLDTYIGPMTAQRILAGKIRQGEIETMQAALLLCDMKGFTELSNRLPDEKVLQLLNAYFDAVIPAITSNGGEVLKFMGDAALAFFPTSDAVVACRRALAATAEIFANLAGFEQNGARVEATVGLHYGKVSYGNIGSGRRLDLTVIGSDVNLLSRIQTACGGLGKSLLMSDMFRRSSGADNILSTKFHRLKGFADPIELFTIAE
ncbi:adenylate/guanylate cyclase domain-containing protein (plasmid) [Rhizobium sp. T1470]|uniref:adenylate/guanylate cyclase domain-containing protein n=1 Tax=unclassified Rhizobium TaxID=2613769 RepID=UPI001AAF17C2|nr:adenylate/guanylate cyclase domain-containing protein [Rhizobium sp. T1473]MCA0806680.1 adenylate/guanylate cyclase domain-containing protein [Rhizobium sp. T1473]